MLSIVNYGSSDSEDNISDEEEIAEITKAQNGMKIGESKQIDENLELSSRINLPQPINKANETIQEEDDEFLHKKEVPEVKPPVLKVKEKVKIVIPKLSDFKDDDDDEEVGPKYPTASNRKTGLLNMLPKPSHGSVPSMNKTLPSVQPKQSQAVSKNIQQDTEKSIQASTSSSAGSSNSQEITKKIGLIPYALMDHSKKKATTDDSKKLKKKPQDSDDSDEETSGTFFSFDSKEDELPKVNEDEIKALIAKETNRMEERKRKSEQPDDVQYEEQNHSQYYQQQEHNQFDQEALKALVGGTKAKRTKVDDIQILDISENNLIDKDEWLRKNIAGETSFIPTGKIDEKGPSALAKRKHQISYLAMRAEKNMAELEAMWATNRQTNREARSKYGF